VKYIKCLSYFGLKCKFLTAYTYFVDFIECFIVYDCSGERQLALQSAAKNSSQWRSSFEQVADWLTAKEAIVIGLQQLSCDFERLGQQSIAAEVKRLISEAEIVNACH